ncbi:MAG: NAD(P)H-hydrate dehydratase [Lautropia sp.]
MRSPEAVGLASGLYTVAAIRRIESSLLAQYAPGTLMRRAAAAVAAQATRMLRTLPADTTVVLLVGPGNNGGDALLAGRLLIESGFAVRACAFETILRQAPIPQDAAAAWRAWHADGLSLLSLFDRSAWQTQRPPLVIDGLFGIGLSRPLPAEMTPLIAWLKRSRAQVLAIDVPSGIDADSGAAIAGGPVVPATVTVTMIADKPGLHTGPGLAAAGNVRIAALVDTPDSAPAGLGPVEASSPPSTLAIRGVRADAVLLDEATVPRLLPARSVNAHKGTSGDVLIVGGRLGMAGAARLAARGALGAGAGRVSIASDARSSDAADPRRPEIMRAMVAATDPIPTRFKVVAIGCGLGQDQQAWQYLRSVIASRALMICDADALNLLAVTPELVRLVRQRSAPTILTPHPLEAARLLDLPTGRVQSDRIGAACALARRFNAIAVLKGAGSVVADPQNHFAINASGNPVLATGGTGDVLAGVIAALAAGTLGGVGSTAATAACAGVWLHGAAADLAARHLGPAGVPAGRIADWLPAVFRYCRR